MVRVAVAGGTSPTLGKSVVESIMATGNHEVIILSRANKDREAQTTAASASQETKYGARVFEVPYTLSDDQKNPSPLLLSSLKGVHTLVSVIKILDPTQMLESHRCLVLAAQQAQVSRFIMSDWSMGPLSHQCVDVLAHKADMAKLGSDHMKGREPGMQRNGAGGNMEWVVECCTVQNGMFMEYLLQKYPGSGQVQEKEREEDLTHGLEDDLLLDYIDVANRKLLIPAASPATCEGSTPEPVPVPVSMTSIKDIGRFIAASLSLPPGLLTGQVGLAGCTTTFSSIREILLTKCGMEIPYATITAEQCGEIARKFQTQFEESMAKGEFNVEAFKSKMVAQMYALMCKGQEGGGIVKGGLNELCPEVEPIDVEELLVKAWGRERSGS